MLIIQNTLVLRAHNQQIKVTFTCLYVCAVDTDYMNNKRSDNNFIIELPKFARYQLFVQRHVDC